MKRIITFLFALIMIFALATPALAVTPPLQMPNLPKVPEIKFEFKFLNGFWDKYWDEHPLPDIEIPESTEPEPEETEPEETEPEVTELEAPVIIKSQFYHGRYQRLQIEWDAVEGAESYEVLITKADGETNEYTTESTIVYDSGAQCPRVYIDEKSTWASATVKVRAVCGDVVSEWSKEKKIGCDMLHFM